MDATGWRKMGCEESREATEAKAVAETREQSAVIEKAIRKELNKPTGELTKADLEKVTVLDLESNQLTSVSPLVGLSKLEVLGLCTNRLIDVSALAGLKQLKELHLQDNPQPHQGRD